MAILLEIDNGDGRGRVDYTGFVAATDRSPAVLRDRINQPALFDFALASMDASFAVPRRSAYVRLTGQTGSAPASDLRLRGAIFTGFITSEPEADYLGSANGRHIHGWRCQATSEEYLLNVKRIGWQAPLMNRTAGEILRVLAQQLLPGRFEVSNIADGPLVPVFAIEPDALWSDIARQLAERAGFFYRVLDGAITFQPLGSEVPGITIDESERNFRPESLEIRSLGNPVHNDVTALGAAEPQAFVKEYFVGDGFTSRFALAAPVFGAETQRLLADDFAGATIDTAKWEETDPLGAITLFQGRLNGTGGTGVLGETALVARQAMELGGELELVHGEFEFVAPSTGVLGGLYDGAGLAAANCLIGFELSPLGGASRIRALIQGVVQAPEVAVQANHHYILATRVSADQPYRVQQTFAAAETAHGGAAIPANVRVALEVRDIDLAHAHNDTRTTIFEATLGSLPSFATYAPVNAADLHFAANFLQITRPIQALLETQLPGEAPRVRSLGFGIAGHDATITSDAGSNQWALEFYEDTLPARGEKIMLTYRASGRAAARVTDSASIMAEAALAGDDGRRAVVLGDVTPAPRTSEEAEAAALAYLDDHAVPRYEGRYTTWGAFAASFPRTGARIEVRNESRAPAFRALARGVTTEFRELGGEHALHSLDFGEPSRFEEMLRRFAPAERVLSAGQELAPPVFERSEVGTAFLADVPEFSLAGVNPAQVIIDMSAPPPPGGLYEVRRGDQGWSTANSPGTAQNLLGTFGSPTFTLPRTGRDQLFCIRPVAAGGATSRYSCVLAVRYPQVPAAPDAVLVQFGADASARPIVTVTVEIGEEHLPGVDAVELRDGSALATLARWDFGQLEYSGGVYRARHVVDNSATLSRAYSFQAFTQNVLGEFSPARAGAGSLPQPLKPALATGNSVGQILEILLDSVAQDILETQVQVAPPSGSFLAPSQDVVLPGQPQKFSFVASQSGGWAFRARRRDALGWSPWSDEAQGQTPAQTLAFAVQFFHADELDPSIGAAINGQNLLPNSEFFLGGVAGQEGTHVARYFTLASAANDGSEVDFVASTNEMQWKSGVSFAASNPGFRSKLSNLGRLLNPGESVTLSAALRHHSAGGFARAVRLALRSASTPTYEQSREIPVDSILSDYRWYSGVFLLPANQAVPDDLSIEVTVVVGAGQSLASALFCDKVILNRGQRPAAFSLAPWDVVPLAWNSVASAYDLPATLAGGTPRSTNPGNAGLLAGTGTEDLDPDFPGRYTRIAS